MNREIKFRAWDEEAALMFYSDDLPCEPNVRRGFTFYDGYVISFIQGIISIEYVPVMQFTEVLDNKQQPIYEGDIIDCIEDLGFTEPDGYPKGPTTTGFIEFYAGGFVLNSNGSRMYSWTDHSEIYVRGNIYEHPHLLKRK